MDDCLVVDLVLGDDVVDGSAELAVAGGEDSFWFAEAELDEVRVVDVNIEEGAAGFFAVEEILLSPAGRFSDATEASGEDLAVGSLGILWCPSI